MYVYNKLACQRTRLIAVGANHVFSFDEFDELLRLYSGHCSFMLLADDATLDTIVDDLTAFELVTDVMESFPNSSQIQWFGCSLVACLGLQFINNVNEHIL